MIYLTTTILVGAKEKIYTYKDFLLLWHVGPLDGSDSPLA